MLFFSLVRHKLKQSLPSITPLDVSVLDKASVISQLETTFLGTSNFYWLNNVHTLSEKQRKIWLAYLQTYNGPNTVSFFIDTQTKIALPKKTVLVSIPDAVDKKSYVSLLFLFKVEQLPGHTRFIQELFKRHRVLSLDVACVMLNYMFLGAQGSAFFDQWLDTIIGSDGSLFALSQYFFAKDVRLFSKQWHKLKDQFPDIFWVTFWSEQLWRAYNYVYLSNKKQFIQAKKIGFRLPFSFMQRDWRSFSCAELKNAHQFVYDLDFKLKNSSGVPGLDLLYSKFLLNKFTDSSYQ